jgi:hypothetical protein
MVREWTEEQRAEASRRAKEQGFGGRPRTAAAVEIHEVEPVGAPARSNAVLLAEEEGRMVKSVDEDGGDGVVTTHTRPGTTTMYKPSKDGYQPRTVSVSALRLLLIQGWKERCPDCNSEHIGPDGQHSTDPNLCAARDPIAVRVCPVCTKRLYDNIGFTEDTDAEGEADPNVIREEAYSESTPETRTKASLDLHLWQKHPRQAQMMGVPPLPAAMSDMVERRN